MLFSCSEAQPSLPKTDQAIKDGNILIVYLSRTNNTKAVAEMIQNEVGGTLVALELENPYPENYHYSCKLDIEYLICKIIDRKISDQILKRAQTMPGIAVTGTRQSGKSTLVQALFPGYTYRNLEDIELRQFAIDDPKAFLQECGDGCIIDEIQYAPDLLSYIQVITDQNKIPGQFIISGSQNLLLMESVAVRKFYHQ